MFDCPEARRWLRQAKYTLRAIDADVEADFYSWACFKGHQAADYALKAVLRGAGVESFGHDLVALWVKAKRICPPLEGLRECIALLNKMYIPPRYPDAWAGESAPYESYTRRDAVESRECATLVLNAVKSCLEEVCGEGTGSQEEA